MLINVVGLHYDNDQPDIAAVTIEMIKKLKFKLLLHPAYHSDLTPSHYQTFWSLKDALHGHQFANDEEVKDTAHICSSAIKNILHIWHQEAHEPK
jgi:hypothetical protein